MEATYKSYTPLSYFEAFTNAHKSTNDKSLREARCLAVQYPYMLGDLQAGDMFVGRYEYPCVYFVPQSYSAPGGFGYGYVYDGFVVEKIRGAQEWTAAENAKWDELITYWEKEGTAGKARPKYTVEIAETLPSDEWLDTSGAAFPLYRMAGSILNYDFLLQLGLPGVKALLDDKIANTTEAETISLYKAMQASLDTVSKSALHYAEMVSEQLEKTPAIEHADHLQDLVAALTHIASKKPETLLQAIQLFYLYNTMAGSLNFGRMDEYLGDFYVQDIANGTITEEQATVYLEGLWRLISTRNTIFDGRLVLGGKGRRNEENADAFSMIALEATRRVRDILPQVSLRFYEGGNKAPYQKGLDVLGEGNTYPMLYNDDVNIPSVSKSFGLPFEEAQHYLPYGCGEYVINHRSFGTPNGLLNTLKALETVIHGGVDIITNKPVAGMAAVPAEGYQSFDQFLKAYQDEVDRLMNALAPVQQYTYEVGGEDAPFLYMSMLFDDCIGRGKGIFQGGIRYLGGTMETYGNTNAADSLTAIKKLVFDEKVLTLKELSEALQADFVGYEAIQKQLLACPKYGNDDPVADEMTQVVHEHVCLSAQKARVHTNLHNYLIVNINNHANTILGRLTGASADGRKAFTYMANANNPTGGQDKKGLTAMLNSLVKLDTTLHAGAVQNMKFSPSLFHKHRPMLEAVLGTYFKNGGAQAMPTVINKEDLEQAMITPEKYPNLMVRVGGFSARFVELMRDVQEEIVSRTTY